MRFLPLGLPKSPFGGWCVDGSDKKIAMKDFKGTNPQECHNHCIDNKGCVAFAYQFTGTGKCELYEGGPYTKGDHSPGTKCYIMPGKVGIF